MEFVDGRLFLEKCQELGCPIYHKFEAFARHEFEKRLGLSSTNSMTIGC